LFCPFTTEAWLMACWPSLFFAIIGFWLCFHYLNVIFVMPKIVTNQCPDTEYICNLY
jgi:hypothetical protein